MKEYDTSINQEAKYLRKSQPELEKMLAYAEKAFDRYITYDRGQDKAKAAIRNHISQTIAQEIGEYETAKELWDAIEAEHVKTGTAEFIELMNELMDTLPKDDNTAANIAVFGAKLSVILNKIDKIGGIDTKKLGVYHYMMALGNHYTPIVNQIQQEADFPKLTEVIQRVERHARATANAGRYTVRQTVTQRGRTEYKATVDSNPSLHNMASNLQKRKSDVQLRTTSLSPTKRPRITQQLRSSSRTACGECGMSHKSKARCWYIHPEDADIWWNKEAAAAKLKAFKEKQPGS